MRKLRIGAVLALAALSASAAFATNAYAFPTQTSQCRVCHSGPNVPVTATLASMAGATATYNVSAPGAFAIAVFDGNTKLAVINAAAGQFSVTAGKTYTVFAVTGPTTGNGLGSTSVSPVVVASPVDTTAPVTTSNSVAAYVSNAVIALTATDAGSGVAHTYYRLDGGAQAEGKAIAVSTLGNHSIEFWSVDVAGNVEAHKTASFTITAPVPPADTIAPVTTSNAVASYVGTAAITLTATDAGSGVAHTFYALDGGAQAEGTSLTANTVGVHNVVFFSVDVAGNTEVSQTATFEITAPQPPIVPVPPVTPPVVGDSHHDGGDSGRYWGRHHHHDGYAYDEFVAHIPEFIED